MRKNLYRLYVAVWTIGCIAVFAYSASRKDKAGMIFAAALLAVNFIYMGLRRRRKGGRK